MKCEQLLFSVSRLLLPPHALLVCTWDQAQLDDQHFPWQHGGLNRACRETQSHLRVLDIIKAPPLPGFGCLAEAGTLSLWQLLKVGLGHLKVWWFSLGQSWPSGILEFIGSREFVLHLSLSNLRQRRKWDKKDISILQIMQIMQYMSDMHIYRINFNKSKYEKYAKYVNGTNQYTQL